MARPFRFAVQARRLAERDEVRSAARQAEDLGYEEFYSFDHLGTVDPFVPLMVAAEATSTLRVGPLVLNNEFHHPALLARTAATMDRIIGGRLVLGIGTGYAQSEHDAMSLELRAPGQRVHRFEESLAALRSLLDSGAVEMRGQHHRLAISDLGVRPLQEHVPLLVGGNGRRVIHAAGRFADIFQFTGLTFVPTGPDLSGFALDEVAKRAAWLSDAAGERDGSIERSVLVQRAVVQDSAHGGAVDDAVGEISAEFALPEAVVRATPFLLVGSVPQMVDRLQQLRELIGVSHVVVREAAAFAPVVAALAGC